MRCGYVVLVALRKYGFFDCGEWGGTLINRVRLIDQSDTEMGVSVSRGQGWLRALTLSHASLHNPNSSFSLLLLLTAYCLLRLWGR